MASNYLKKPQMTSKELTDETAENPKSKNKIDLKGGSVHEDFENNDESFDKFLHNNNL